MLVAESGLKVPLAHCVASGCCGGWVHGWPLVPTPYGDVCCLGIQAAGGRVGAIPGV